MRPFVVFSASFLAGLVLSCGADAMLKAGPNTAGPGAHHRLKAAAAIDGPGDIAAFTVWWGLRAYNKTKCTGSVPALRLRRVLDSVEADIPVATTCDLDTPAAVTHCAGTSCTLAIAYDQTGNNACGGASCDCVQTSTAAQLAFVFNCLGTKPCVQSAATAVQCISANNFTPATGTQSLHYVGGRTAGTVATVPISVGSLSRIATAAGAANWSLLSSAGSVVRAATDGAWHVAAGVATAGANLSSLSIDGVTTAGTVTPGVTVGAPLMGRGGAGATQSTVEGGFIDNAIFSAGQITNLNTNARTWWGIP